MDSIDEAGIMDILQAISFEVELISPSDYRSALDRERLYNGQPQTDTGERGKTELKGITMRDVRDCFIIGAFEAAGIEESKRGSIYELDLNDIDPLAWEQNLACHLERRMGIYPNVSELVYKDDDLEEWS
jgi:hypothetical protein